MQTKKAKNTAGPTGRPEPKPALAEDAAWIREHIIKTGRRKISINFCDGVSRIARRALMEALKANDINYLLEAGVGKSTFHLYDYGEIRKSRNTK